ncbi:hypothetical protein GCM10010919_17730 [Alishewanella longhuensis]|uniref:DUF4381 domain-containing protein n=1 Tax=Alishewanella longhuensis TaxID=1091037 RepID=A0ABQ3KXK6_9ALTE|nr:DUF4381 domain-containing protein [Alishewanella longhuensis]GHG68344.1 hypothetical protein GCM10010919_17730 [Alishewanella longhuensis]
MVANSDLLPHLADIYEPELIIAWQPALGHWLLLAIILIILAVLLWQGYRRWQAGQARRAALLELKQLNWQEPSSIAAINQLLKRLLQSYQPSHPLLSGDVQSWQQFLQSQLPKSLPLPELQKLLYQPPALTSELVREQWWYASAYIIKHFNAKTGAIWLKNAPLTAPAKENNHA